MSEQRRERLRVGWVHAGPVAGLLVYLAASEVNALKPVTAMVTAVQALWFLFGVGMFLHALWGTEERSWIPRAGGLIVAVGLMAAWEIGVVWPQKDWKILEHEELQVVPALGRVVRFLLIWAYARGLHARSGSYLLSWWVPWVLTLEVLERNRVDEILLMPGFDRQFRSDPLEWLACAYAIRGASLITIALNVECLYGRFRGFGVRNGPGAGHSSLLLPLLIATGPIWLVHEMVAARTFTGDVAAVRNWGGTLPRVVFPKEAVSVACLCLGIITAWLVTPSGKKWRGVSARFLVAVGAAVSCFLVAVLLSSAEVPWLLAWILIGVFGLAMLADQPRPGRGFTPTEDSRCCVRSLVEHFSSPLAGWGLKGSRRYDWLLGPVLLGMLLMGSVASAQFVGGANSPYRLGRMLAHRESLREFLFIVKWITIDTMALLPVPVILWLLCQRLGARWGREQLEQLKVTPLRNWDIWWAITIPAVRSMVVLMIYGIVFSSILATVGRQLPEDRWRELSGDDYAVQSLLAMGLLCLIVAGSLLVIFVRRSGKAGPLLFARVVAITVMVAVLVLFFVWIPWAWGFDSSVGSLPQRVLLFVGLAYLPYLALHGVPRDIDGLFDESARS